MRGVQPAQKAGNLVPYRVELINRIGQEAADETNRTITATGLSKNAGRSRRSISRNLKTCETAEVRPHDVHSKTIPDMFVEAYENQTEVARILNCSRNTVRKYTGDKEGKDTLSSTVFLWFTADGVKILMRDIRQVLSVGGMGGKQL